MFEVIRSEYGRELGSFEFDYLGEHPHLDAIIMNASVKLFEQGLLIRSGLTSGYVYIRWSEISGITCTNEKENLLEIFSVGGVVKLQKVKEETDLNQLKQLFGEMIPDIEIEDAPVQLGIVKSIEFARESRRLAQQEHRIQTFIAKSGTNDEGELMESWQQYLTGALSLPFEAKVIESSSPLQEGDIVKVIGLDDVDDLYGIIASLKKGRKKFWHPLCELEAIDKESDHFRYIDDYTVWFGNR